jgi:hypothetical protein
MIGPRVCDRGFCEEVVPFADGMAEISLLLPGWQAAALEQAAMRQGMSAGQFLRRLIDNSLPCWSLASVEA